LWQVAEGCSTPCLINNTNNTGEHTSPNYNFFSGGLEDSILALWHMLYLVVSSCSHPNIFYVNRIVIVYVWVESSSRIEYPVPIPAHDAYSSTCAPVGRSNHSDTGAGSSSPQHTTQPRTNHLVRRGLSEKLHCRPSPRASPAPPIKPLQNLWMFRCTRTAKALIHLISTQPQSQTFTASFVRVLWRHFPPLRFQ
jgi:hypothetical protein